MVVRCANVVFAVDVMDWMFVEVAPTAVSVYKPDAIGRCNVPAAWMAVAKISYFLT